MSSDSGRDEAQRRLAALERVCQGPRGGRAVMRGLYLCAVHELDHPTWLRMHIIRRIGLVEKAELASWDDAMGGRPWPKSPGALANVRTRLAQQVAVYHRVWALAIDGGRPVNHALWAEVGKEFGVSASTAERRYQAEVESGQPSISSVR